jgi:hypothetical protein
MLAFLATSAYAQNPTHNRLIGRSNPVLSGFHLRSLPTQDSPGTVLQNANTPSGIAVSYGTVDYPRVLNSGASGINKQGQIVGAFSITASGCSAGYLQAGISFRKIAYPGSTQSCPVAINDLGEIAGGYSTDGGNTYHIFSLVGTTFTAIPDPPGATDTDAGGIDNLGRIVGGYVDSSDVVHGFVYSNGTFTVVDVPGASYTLVRAVSPNGTIMAGDYVGADGHDHGFLLNGGVFTTVDYPGAADTELLGVNDFGSYVGNWGNGTIVQSYLEYNGFLFKSGSYVPLTLPWAGVSVTWPSALNNKAQIAGLYVDSNGIILGFYAAVH